MPNAICETPVMDPTEADYNLIRAIDASGGESTSSTLIDRIPYERLVELGWLVCLPAEANQLHFSITPRGKEAASR